MANDANKIFVDFPLLLVGDDDSVLEDRRTFGPFEVFFTPNEILVRRGDDTIYRNDFHGPYNPSVCSQHLLEDLTPLTTTGRMFKRNYAKDIVGWVDSFYR